MTVGYVGGGAPAAAHPDLATHDTMGLATDVDLASLVTLATAQTLTGLKTITPSAIGAVGLIVKGLAGQTANLQEWQDSASVVLARIASNGNQTFSNGSVRTTTIGNFLFGSDYNGGISSTGDGALVLSQDGTGAVAIRTGYATRCTWASNGNLTFNSGSVVPSAVGAVGVIIKGLASQTADLQQWQDSAGAVLARVTSIGRLTGTDFAADYIRNSVTTGPYLSMRWSGASIVAHASVTTDIPFTCKGVASQTGDLQRWQNSVGTTLSKISANGEPEVVTAGVGLVLKSPNGTRYRVTVADDGALITGVAA